MTYDKSISALNKYPQPNKDIFLNFIDKVQNAGWKVVISNGGGYRTYDEQVATKRKYGEGAATPGNSDHGHYGAIDINCSKNGVTLLKKSTKSDWRKSGIPGIAKNSGLEWGGDIESIQDPVHFNIPKKDNQYVPKGKYSKKVPSYSVEIGTTSISEKDSETTEPDSDEMLTVVNGFDEFEASGIWQVIKLVADQYSLSQNINDATIAFNQGSLLNFVQKVVQQPWLQFFGDTVGDQYYFFSRKEPFDYRGFVKLPIVKNIQENDVLSADLDWYSGTVYSWYQLLPKGIGLSGQEVMFTYIKAVFFEEYAEIWGSKSNIQVNNYITFNKIDDKDRMSQKAIADLRYMVESNVYLPFTRNGTIVVAGDNTIKRGYRIFLQHTGEYFYVDSVSHSYNTNEEGPSFTTTLVVSRGVIKKHFKKYFQLIKFDNKKETTQKYKEAVKDLVSLFYFDNGRNYLIDLNEEFKLSSATDVKIRNQIKQYPSLRKDLALRNKVSIDGIVKLIKRHKGQKFICEGNIDEDNVIGFPKLSRQRAQLIKDIAITEYLKNNTDITRAQLESDISIQFNKGTDGVPYFVDESNHIVAYNDENTNESSYAERAHKRNAKFYVKPYEQEKQEKVIGQEINWQVDRKIFDFFINRKQNTTDV